MRRSNTIKDVAYKERKVRRENATKTRLSGSGGGLGVRYLERSGGFNLKASVGYVNTTSLVTQKRVARFPEECFSVFPLNLHRDGKGDSPSLAQQEMLLCRVG